MKYFCYQTGINDCGFASLKMLLANLYHNSHYLYLGRYHHKEQYSLFELEEIAKEHGLKLKSYRYENNTKYHQLPKMFLASFKGEKNYHLVLVKKVMGLFLVFDPNQGKYYLSRRKFFRRFAYLTLEVISYNKQNYRAKALPKIKPLFQILIMVDEFLATLTLIAAFFTFPYAPIYLPFIFLALFAILEIILGQIILSSLKTFDRQYLTLLNQKKITKEHYHLFQNYKSKLYLSPRQLFSSLLIILLVGATLMLFNYLYVIGNAIIFLINVLEYLFITPLLKKQEYCISLLENDLFASNKKQTLSFIESLHLKSYRYINYLNVTKYFKIFLIFILALILSLLLDALSMTNFFFLFFSLFYLNSHFKTAFDFEKDYQVFLKEKMLFYETFIA